jgi:hypothetical protein
MFGHNDDQSIAENAAQPVAVSTMGMDDQVTSAPPMSEAAGDYIATAIPGQPASTDTTISSQGLAPLMPPAPAAPIVEPVSAPVAPAATTNDDDNLLDIKRQALQQLTPLIDRLDQTPEEKFRTTMMMIQASDNNSLVKQAYEAAQQITDENARAQALLDIVNEINYFTQQHGTEA